MASGAQAAAESPDALTVVLVDDEALIRAGLRMLLEAETGIEVVGEAADGHAGVELIARMRPDVVVMDVRMPGTDGVEATRRLTSAEYREAHGDPPGILILTTFSDDIAVRDAVRAGAAGFLLKSAAPSVLAEAVRALAKGDGWLDPAVTRALLHELASRAEPAPVAHAEIEQLTRREREVLRAIADGRTNTQIAKDLFLSEATVKTHVHRIFLKLGISDRAQAVAVAFRTGLVRAD
ncbi:response regulator transcription factor [Microbacterium rhizophilus]|uniref:response regulator transcription factor n=1 Tax=Microbacterium rhizophilus TaxID=3138934 RepID=UPI0031ED6FB5